MRVTTSALGTLGLITAIAGILRASGVDLDVRVLIVMALLALSLLLAASAFATPHRAGEGASPGHDLADLGADHTEP